ncbi:hypothetical protein H072_1120 [Dactylellina haptotyla CBS 200.50]|uniref:Uncharacterized protein n=1 Tax=Dactylellina haptotyla (strain CBS 200.50) TaxID=1284197 RepID=S8BZM4_DACHA|nr:hypothetical protein H072_1120 [Dactylellina haptotyla CBS 200.50]
MATHQDTDDGATTPGASSTSRRSRSHPHLVTKNAVSFMALLADILRLYVVPPPSPDEYPGSTLAIPTQEQSLATAYVYMHKYRKFIRDSNNHAAATKPGAEPAPDFLDPHTLALTCLSLSTKSTESPRRLRSLITPAYTLLHPLSPPIRVPSHLYDTLRATIVTSELYLLRILKFELRIPLPHEYIPRVLDTALSIIPGEELSSISTEKMEEDKISRVVDTYLGRQCVNLATRCLGEYSIATFYDAKTIACGVVGVVLEENGVVPGEGVNRWVDMVAGRDVDLEDFRDVVKEVRVVYNGRDGAVEVQEIQTDDDKK